MSNTTHIRAIETSYKGYRFRSRLEARWAVFMDSLGIEWIYENEGYDIAGEWYLPDFILPEQKIILEIKPKLPADQYYDTDLLELLSEKIGMTGYILSGQPWVDDKEGFHNFDCIDYSIQPAIGDTDYLWCECTSCGAIGIEYSGRAERVMHFSGCKNTANKDYAPMTKRLMDAYKSARSARFEHGESGTFHSCCSV